MPGRPELFVLCKNCGREVSPYITECPYCGARLRKRAPKIERDRGEALPRGRRAARPGLGARRAPRRHAPRGPHGDLGGRPVVTFTLVVLSLFGFISLAFVTPGDLVLRTISDDPWRYLTAAFAYGNGWYQFAALTAIGLFGWRLELRYGPVLVLALFILAGIGGIAAAVALDPAALPLGANGAALGLTAAWAVPIALARGRDEDDGEADLLGASVIFVTVAAMPIATHDADALAGVVGLAVGAVAGLALDMFERRRGTVR
jgi:membrane associated rhomboid family serine protease